MNDLFLRLFAQLKRSWSWNCTNVQSNSSLLRGYLFPQLCIHIINGIIYIRIRNYFIALTSFHYHNCNHWTTVDTVKLNMHVLIPLWLCLVAMPPTANSTVTKGNYFIITTNKERNKKKSLLESKWSSFRTADSISAGYLVRANAFYTELLFTPTGLLVSRQRWQSSWVWIITRPL